MATRDGDVVVTERGGKLFVQSYDKADTGILIAQSEPSAISVLENGAEDEALGSEILLRLDACREGVFDDPSTWHQPLAIWSVAGVKSEKQLSRGAIFIMVEREGGAYRFSSVKTVKSGGFDEFKPPRTTENRDENMGANRIGKMAREALSKSEGVK